jgi:hypothetical protein
MTKLQKFILILTLVIDIAIGTLFHSIMVKLSNN